ncbi:MAG: sodium:solute symporter [Bacteroidetes bacterium]|nr:MAG: sodium:solute symporter [Bacteroidota bacterium]
MSSIYVLSIIVIYFGILMVMAHYTSKGADTDAFFTGNRSSPWYIVAFGMIGTSLSGVTFISVPGAVGSGAFGYFQMVLGYLIGYAFIAFVLMPIYYRMNLVSIYGYLEQRLGLFSYKTGSFFFLLSRTIGASFRLYLAAEVLQIALFDAWNVPFALTVFITIALIWIYTFKGGIKTIVWTDSFQTIFLISSVIICVILIKNELGLDFNSLITTVSESKYSQLFFWDAKADSFFVKQFVAGIFIAIVMTGLDQDLMQKNLTCKNIKEAQWNMSTFCVILIIVNFLFLTLGALLYIYCEQRQIALPTRADQLFPMLALNHFGLVAGTFFLLGIIASSYASADSALASLTTAFCIDFLNFGSKTNEKEKSRTKFIVHISFSVLLLLVILLFKAVNDQSVVTAVFKVAGYTYGPLLGMFFFGLFTKYQVKDKLVPFICVCSPLFCYVLNLNSKTWFGGYSFGFELLLVNGAFTFLGLFFARKIK